LRREGSCGQTYKRRSTFFKKTSPLHSYNHHKFALEPM
jgi:hypothetical protein